MNIMKTTVLAGSLALAGCATNTDAKIVANATTEDHKCLAEAIYYEAGSEATLGKHAVAHVVVNRTLSGRYPNSICKVVYERNYKKRGCQFSWSCRKRSKPHGVRWEEAQEVATLVLTGKSQDVSRGALLFSGRRDRVNYSSQYQKTVVIGGHTFWGPKRQQARAENR